MCLYFFLVGPVGAGSVELDDCDAIGLSCAVVGTSWLVATAVSMREAMVYMYHQINSLLE